MKSTERLVKLVPHDKALHAPVGLILYSFIALYSPAIALVVVIFVGLETLLIKGKSDV